MSKKKKSHRKGVSMEDEYGTIKANKLKKRISRAVRESMKKGIKYTCHHCNEIFKSNKFAKFCSEKCAIDHGSLIIGNCCMCDHQVKKHAKTNNLFCGRECYYLWKKIFGPPPPQNEFRLQRANSPAAKKKRYETRLKNGTIARTDIFVEGLNFKEYVKLVRGLTKKMRNEVYKNWDGYDHYEPEKYIKNNFNLHFTNGDFPCIDHKISVLTAFNKKWPPIKVCRLSNLVVTTKRNNSRKNQKSYKKFKKYMMSLNTTINET